MSKVVTCTIPSIVASYEIMIQTGILNDSKNLRQNMAIYGSRFAVITDENVSKSHGESLCHSLKKEGLDAFLFTFPSGEQHKTRATKELLENQLFEKGLGRDTCILAIGGGVVTDLVGYLAATYCRGLPLIMIPTTLLGMVDASIGGKTGVNVPYGKNLLGCVYQPKKVIVDLDTLKSLPIAEVRNGSVEMIKHGLIADEHYFEFLENNAEQVLKKDDDVLEKAIFESCLIKKRIVEEDERETGKRHLLNFGHTVGHALERATMYAISHGEAVAIGLLVECHLAVQLGHLDQKSLERVHHVLLKYGLPLRLPVRYSFEDLYKAMMMDKKSERGTPRFVIISKIGSPLPFDSTYCTQVDKDLIKNSLQWMNDALCCH